LPVPSAELQARAERLQSDIAILEKTRENYGFHLAKAQAEWERRFQSSAKPPPPAGAYAHWPLSIKAGRTVFDLGRKGRHARIHAEKSPVWHSAALRFDGSGMHVDCGNIADFERTDTFSYGGWVNSDTANGCILSRIDDPKAYRGYDLFVNDDRFEVHIAHSWPDNAIKVRTAKCFPRGKWRHVFVTYDGTSKAGGVQMYVDGENVPLVVEKDSLTDSIRTDVSLKLGRRHVAGPFQGLLRDFYVYDRALHPDEIASLARAHPTTAIARLPRDQRTLARAMELAAYYRTIDPELAAIRERLTEKRGQLAAVQPPTTMVMVELPKPRENFVMLRGAFNQKGKPVEPNTPAALHPYPQAAPRNRLGLARWLVDRANPLTARVTINRHWEVFFGRGLVQSPEDFGSQGEKPTHPELIDWLAAEWMESGWSMKTLHRMIVQSATYRQASRQNEESARRDPNNELLSRGPRMRVEYETLRDMALACGGLLSQKIGGPSVMPPQPPGVWENSFGFYDLPDFRWKESTGADRYRRGLYTFLRRTALYPTFAMFDAPSRDVCSVKRPRTNTPLQALATLNDPVFVEAARALAQRALSEVSGDTHAKVQFLFRVCTSRAPRASEVDRLVALYMKTLERCQTSSQGQSTESTSEQRAWTVIANVVLNLDEVLTKG
jgi:hypothetical protein